ncbi:MAG TPA: endonuclease/exonuclease/phosphatase family protein [Planococcus sp. (in: firmicutes)]|nr:endonuclease/exonuclease/phosphatase family protein [Planococcus sp. (in: firmicutes)]
MSSEHIQLKVMSFNIAAGKKLDGTLDLELTATTIEKSGADIIGLQEVDRNFSARSNFTDQAKWLGQKLNMHISYGLNLTQHPDEQERPKRQYGNVTLSKYPVAGDKNYDLACVPEEGEENEPRGLLETVIEVRGRKIAFYNTHLSLKKQEVKVNIQELLGVVTAKEMPVLIVGDFNQEPDSEPIQTMEQRFSDVFGNMESHPSTYKKNGNHGKKIDYIFHDENWQVEKSVVIDTEASDHFPVVAEMILFTKS